MFALLHHGQGTAEPLGERSNHLIFGQFVRFAVQNGGGGFSGRDRIVPDIAIIIPIQGLPDGKRNLLLGPQSFRADVKPLHHVIDEAFHIDNRR